MVKKIKKLSETSRGGRRQITLNNQAIRETIEAVCRQTGVPFQKCFDQFCDMLCEGYVYGLSTHAALFARVIEKEVKH